MTPNKAPCNVLHQMRALILILCAWVLHSCALPFIGTEPSSLPGPPKLRVAFDAAAAAATLAWEANHAPDFHQYYIRRARGDRGFQTVAVIAARYDTSYTDDGLLANTTYRYQVVAERLGGDRDGENRSIAASETRAGDIHGFVNSWLLPTGFLPTRIAIDPRGTLCVVGAGAGWIERFDRGGNSLGQWEFSALPNACLETGTLDGPAIAIDDEGDLYVTFNTLPPTGAPVAAWSKFDASGNQLWSKEIDAVFARHIAVDGSHVFVESISQLQQFDRDGTRLADYQVPALLVSSLRFWKGYFAALVEPLDFSQIGWRAPRLVLYKNAQRDAVDLVLGRDPLSDDDRGAGLLRRPSDFAIDEEGNRAFVVNAGHGRIEVFKDGRYLTRWSEDVGSGSAFRFAGNADVVDDLDTGRTRSRSVLAGGIARDRDGFVYVADTFNNRIQKFRP